VLLLLSVGAQTNSTSQHKDDECKVIAMAWPLFEAMRDGSCESNRGREGLEGKRRVRFTITLNDARAVA
jgi:hypothetical protein